MVETFRFLERTAETQANHCNFFRVHTLKLIPFKNY
jgi:hypothetical protein